MPAYPQAMSWSTSSPGTPINSATTIIGSRLATALHPLDAPVAQTVGPQPFGGVGDERLEFSDLLGRQIRNQQLAVGGVRRVVGGGECVGGIPKRGHGERCDGAIRPVDHDCGQVRRELVDASDRFDHRVPTGHCVELRCAGATDGSRGTDAPVQGVWILQVFSVKQVDGIVAGRHLSRLSG